MKRAFHWLLAFACLVGPVHCQSRALVGSKPEEDAYGINVDSSGEVTFQFFLRNTFIIKKVEMVVLQTDLNGSKLKEGKIKTYDLDPSPDDGSIDILSFKTPITQGARVCYWIKKMEFSNSKDAKIKDGSPVCFVEGQGDPPSQVPSQSPSAMPSSHPTQSLIPSANPSSTPSETPIPSSMPSVTSIPSKKPTTTMPSSVPSSQPSLSPSATPSASPDAKATFDMLVEWTIPNNSLYTFRVYDASDGSSVFTKPSDSKVKGEEIVEVEGGKDYCFSGSNPERQSGNKVDIFVDGQHALKMSKHFGFLSGTLCFSVHSNGSTSYVSAPPTPTCEQSDANSFNLCIEVEDMSGGLLMFDGVVDYFKQSFIDAKEKWSKVLIADDGRQHVMQESGLVVDDVWIEAAAVRRDGKGGLLGFAGWTKAWYDSRSKKWKPMSGLMGFDAYDVKGLRDRGTFHKVVIHEIGHILGIGSFWEINKIWTGGKYQGENANREYRKLLAAQGLKHKDDVTVPIETDFGPGTAGGHWDEACLKHELMTGFLDAGSNVLSAVTVGGLEDLGYVVDYDAAEPYTFEDYDEKECKQGKQRRRNLKGGGVTRRWRLLHGNGDMHEDDEKKAFEEGKELLKSELNGGDGNHRVDVFWEDKNENIFVVHVTDQDE